MDITLDSLATEKIRLHSWKTKSKYGKEIHRTDLVMCPLKCYCRLLGVPSKPCVKAVESWVIGEAVHKMIQRGHRRVEEEYTLEGVQCHVDMVYNNAPLEIKTTIHPIFSPADIPIEWKEQLIFSMLAMGTNEGRLLILDLTQKLMLVWKVKMESEELREYRDIFVQRKQALERAIEKRDAHMLTPHLDECDYCEYSHSTGCEVWRKMNQ